MDKKEYCFELSVERSAILARDHGWGVGGAGPVGKFRASRRIADGESLSGGFGFDLQRSLDGNPPYYIHLHLIRAGSNRHDLENRFFKDPREFEDAARGWFGLDEEALLVRLAIMEVL